MRWAHHIPEDGPAARYPAKDVLPDELEPVLRARHGDRHRGGHQDFSRAGQCHHPSRDMHGHPRDIGASPLYVADVDRHAYLQVIPERRSWIVVAARSARSADGKVASTPSPVLLITVPPFLVTSSEITRSW